MIEVIFSEYFKKELRKISDKSTRLKIFKALKKLAKNPEAGKPLKHVLKNHRSLRVHPFRIIYCVMGDCIILKCFDHRKSVYK